jgi:hypothetical protein
MTNSETTTFPLLEQILKILGQPLQPMYSARDLARIFKVSVRAIQHRIESGRLMPRDLPGRAKFLPQDIEDFLAGSRGRTHDVRRFDGLHHSTPLS